MFHGVFTSADSLLLKGILTGDVSGEGVTTGASHMAGCSALSTAGGGGAVTGRDPLLRTEGGPASPPACCCCCWTMQMFNLAVVGNEFFLWAVTLGRVGVLGLYTSWKLGCCGALCWPRAWCCGLLRIP